MRAAPVIFIIAGTTACATPAAHPILTPTLTLEQHTLRIPLTVGGDGTVSFSEQPPLLGRIDLSPILDAEGVAPGRAGAKLVQIIVHYGRLYVMSESFRAVWEITPRPGTSTASYRRLPIDREIARADRRKVRLSRYGSSRSSCLRIDGLGGDPVFLTAAGEVRADCP